MLPLVRRHTITQHKTYMQNAALLTACRLVLPRYGMVAFLTIMIASNLFTFTLNMTRTLYCIQKPPPAKGTGLKLL